MSRISKWRKRQKSAFPENQTGSPAESSPVSAAVEQENEKKRKLLEEEKKIPVVFTAKDVSFVVTGYIIFLAFIFSVVLKCEFKSIHDEIKLDENETMGIAEPLAVVVSKHAPAEWAGMKAEIGLATMLGMITLAKLRSAQQIADKEHKRKQSEKAQPIPVNRPAVNV